jgi:head-tail adaptor
VAMRHAPFEPGHRDRTITIQQRNATDAVDSEGAPTPDTAGWTTLVANMPAAKQDIQGRERFVSNEESARFDTRWEINYRVDMDPELVDVPKLRRIVHNGRTYDIVAASEIGRREGLELLTLAGSKVA